MCERQRADVDRAQAAVADELLDGVLGGLVVAREEDVERLAVGNRALDERAGEGGVEGLDDLGPRDTRGDVLRDGARLDGERGVGLRIDRVGDVDDDLPGELVTVAGEDGVDAPGTRRRAR